MKPCKKIIFLILTVLWILLIFSFSLQPAEVSGDLSSGFGRWLLEIFLPGILEQMEDLSAEQLEFWHALLRKGAHFTEYFVLGILVLLSDREFTGKKGYGLWIAFAVCVLVAAADETIQLFVDGRAGRLADVLLDSVGAFCGIIISNRLQIARHCIIMFSENSFTMEEK